MACKPGSKAHSRRDRPLIFLHVGDLHLTELAQNAAPALIAREARLQKDLEGIFEDISSIQKFGALDFVYLPGDLAENTSPGEYARLTAVLSGHRDIALNLIPGDHDRARGVMDAFADFRDGLSRHVLPNGQSAPQAQPSARLNQCVEKPLGGSGPPPNFKEYEHKTQFYFKKTYRGIRCLFLDLVSAGYGQKGVGLDFRLGKQQKDWLERQLAKAKRRKQPCAVFMHCYPADIHDPDEAGDLASLIWNGDVRLVEMGHTHYNELAHDGRTQYATARSVGQNEDGPVGYAVVALDGEVTSWRFKQLQQTWPFVLITSPADRRLARRPLCVGADERICVRALILSDQPSHWSSADPDLRPIVPCEDAPDPILRYVAWCSVDGGEWLRMDYKQNAMFELWVDWPRGSTTISVNVTDGRWESRLQDFIDLDSIEPAAREDEFVYRPKPHKTKLGSGRLQVGPWPRRGIRGDQLGPNNGGRKW